MSISFEETGNYQNATAYLARIKNINKVLASKLDEYGRRGVEALAAATPKRTGLTAGSWKYKITYTKDQIKIEWYNTNMAREAISVAMLLQYGHATKNGGWVEGIDYINPAIGPIFQEMSQKAWEEVKRIK
jgi:hypothetical protein